MLKTVNNVRYLNKNNNANERENYAKWWKEQIEHYGTSVTYYTHGYTLTSHNFLYGEDPTSRYGKFENLILLTDITNDALMLSKFGIMADCDMTAVVHISSFYEKIGCGLEPKAGDLIQLTEYGADRPGGRSAPIYEITERDDEYIQMTNSLMGHYVWYIKCKRFEYSFEPGVPNAPNNKQINDVRDYGRQAGGENEQDLFQPYPDSVQNSAKCIYDYYSEDQSTLGEITNQGDYYVPPVLPPCPEDLTVTGLSAVGGPYTTQTTISGYTVQDLENLISMAQQAEEAINNIVVSVNTSTTATNIDQFMATTISNSADQISYTTINDILDISGSVRGNIIDGGITN